MGIPFVSGASLKLNDSKYFNQDPKQNTSKSERTPDAGKRKDQRKSDRLLDVISDPYNYISKVIKKNRKGYRNGDRVNFPSQINLTVSFGYDKSIKEKFGSESTIKMWLDEVFIHMITYYQHPSLKTTINLRVSFFFIFFCKFVLFNKYAIIHL
jgi:hypothetical protein